MTKNDVMVASQTRAINSEEVAHLTHLLKGAISPRKRLLKAILNSFVVWGCSLLALLMLSGFLSYLSTHSSLVTVLLNYSHLPTIAIITTGCFALFSSYKWLKDLPNPYPLILQDINSGEVVEETYNVQQVCRFQEPELGGFIYFLKISEQDVFVLYDYASQEASSQSKEHSPSDFLVQTQLLLIRAPNSGYYLQHQFSGETVPVSNTYPLTLTPEKWPAADSWSSLSWSQLQ
ncbi:hypothetical protein GCM10007916_27620 [Psychromonas marina]|uniref:Uncharacterized protein n=1 Tax=Psychromonas marina TaxID=88364 RepID=A0ABQ6E3C6_9GAMM|nr:hypothetical protein [Psychromonas marina]GLS91693.1 hypothetical protein GCM10007916_27620 [Psychromonas marina]